MAVLNLSNMFVRQNQNSFGVGGLKGQGLFQQSGPINDMLNRISENMLSAKEQQAEFDSLVTTMTLDAAEQTESPLEDIPDEVLEIYLQVCKVGAHLAATRETSLIEYRSQLSAFDQTIARSGAAELVIRVPVIPGFNDTKKEIEEIAAFARGLWGVRKVHLLPYHRLGQDKYTGLGRKYELEGVLPPSGGHMEMLRKAAEEKSGLVCQIGG